MRDENAPNIRADASNRAKLHVTLLSHNFGSGCAAPSECKCSDRGFTKLELVVRVFAISIYPEYPEFRIVPLILLTGKIQKLKS